jgi:hypothetical protein
MGDSNPKNTQKKKAQQSAKKVQWPDETYSAVRACFGEEKIAASLPSSGRWVMGAANGTASGAGTTGTVSKEAVCSEN